MAGSTKSTPKTKYSTKTAAKADVAKPSKVTPVMQQATGTPAISADPVVKKKDMLARVAARAELRPSEARSVFEAVLEELGEALLRGEKLRLPPLGTVKVNRHKELPNADIVVCKIRRNKASGVDKGPLAPAGD